MTYSRVDMFNDREDVQYVFFKERRPILVFEVVFAQQYLNAGLDAEAAQQ